MRFASLIVAAALLASCSRKTLGDDGPDGGDGTIKLDGGPRVITPDATTGDGGIADVPADLSPDGTAALTGVRSFVVTAHLQADGGIGPLPTSHTFTLVLDADRRIAIAGGPGEGGESAFTLTSPTALTIDGQLQFAPVAGCSGWSIRYQELALVVDAFGQLSGSGAGTLFVSMGDAGFSIPATMSLTGVPDTQPPTLTLSGTFYDPFAPFRVVASEPLRPGSSTQLRAANGETITLMAPMLGGGSVAFFDKPSRILQFGTQYQVVADGLADFAGNPASGLGGLNFFTTALPPLAAEDGFESATETTFGGVEVLSEAGAPTITGARSLYIPATNAGTLSNPPTQPRLALRLQVAAGDTVVRFAYRFVTTGSAVSYGASWVLGRVDGPIAASALEAVANMPTTTATIGTSTVTLGPVTTASFPLPAGAANEVVLQRTFSPPAPCGPPARPASGIIIDDLRVE